MRAKRLLAWGTALAAALVALAGPGCTCGGGLRPEARQDFGETDGAPSAGDTTAYLALARAVVEHREPPPTVPAGGAAGPARRVIVALVAPAPAETIVATASGPTTMAAVMTAARTIAARAPPDAVRGRLELDVPTALADATLEEDTELPLAMLGLEGIMVIADDGKVGAVLPGEIAQRSLFHEGKTAGLSQAKLVPLLASRAGVTPQEVLRMRAYRFRSDAHVESAAHDRPLVLVRGMVTHPPLEGVTPERLLAAVRRGADYLVRAVDAQGRFLYMYHPTDDRDDAAHGWLRHAGATYAVLEAYEELAVPAYLEKAELALRYMVAHLHDDPASQGKYLLDNIDEEQQKVGGAGLALIALAKHAAVTGKRDDLETMHALARLILEQQYADGHFRSNADVERESGSKRKREVWYYPGEAVLGLMRLYAIDPQPGYLDGARRGADWVLRVRDQYVSEDNQEHDHWMSYAVNELYRATLDDAYVEYSEKVARAIEKRQRTAADAPAADFVGTFYEGQTAPASTRVEAYDADIALARFAHKPDRWLIDLAVPVAASMLGQQFDPDNDYWLKNPAKAEGGVRESLFVHDIRIDYVQHAMSAWLHLARILRDSAYGQTGVPSQDPLR